MLLVRSNRQTIKSNKEMIHAFNTFKEHVEKEHDPVINLAKQGIKLGGKVKNAYEVNKWLVLKIGSGIIFLGAVWAAVKVFA
jgi:hypothetical protein